MYFNSASSIAFCLKKKRNQLIWYLFVIVTCLVYYLPVGFYYKLIVASNNDTYTSVVCDFADYNSS